jgi:hypothetical protein
MRTREGIFAFLLLLGAAELVAQTQETGLFVGYETLEMSMNNFANFAGEVGYRVSRKYQARLTVMEVNLTERHLASTWESAAVDGPNVEGYFRGYEAHVDRFFKGDFYVSGALGFYRDQYRHRTTGRSIDNRTFTVGSGVGYTRSDLFGVRGLYVNVDMPVRYYFNGIDRTTWGETTILPHVVVQNIWLFAGIKL